MQYGILELGNEKLVARYVGSAEHLAYNESVLRESLLSLDGRRLNAGDPGSVEKLEWSVAGSSAGGSRLPMPAGWVVEPGAPSPCAGLPPASAMTAAYPAHDVALALRAAVWDTANVVPQEAATACSARRGPGGAASYSLRAEWLGVSYSIEGTFIRLGARQVAQLEVIAPVQKGAFARALLAAWIERANKP